MPNKKILIVDDDPEICQGMHVRLKANHYDPFFASDALTSMVEARKHPPDLIVLDLGLPAGDGYVVMERLKKFPALAVIPIIVVSARDVHANRDRAIKAGARPSWSITTDLPRSGGNCWQDFRQADLSLLISRR